MEIGPDIIAVVTGGASGLGAATATALTRAGAQVTLLDIDADRGRALGKEIGAGFLQCDVSDSTSVAAALADVSSNLGALHVAVNCAGIGPAAKTVSRGAPHDAALFARVIGINLVGTFNLASQAAALMTKNPPMGRDGERGVILSTASVAAYEGQVGQVAYAASKGGVVGMTLPMARDLAPLGIRVCAIAPGLFLTPLLEGLPEEVRQSLGQQVPFPARLGDPDEFAALACHIILNPMLNGEVIRLDGAIRMAPR